MVAGFLFQLDLPTAATLAGAGSVAIAILVMLVARTLPMHLVPGTRTLALGLLAYGAGFLMVANRHDLPAWLPPVIGNGLLVLSAVAAGDVLRRLHRLPTRAAMILGLVLTAVCMLENAWLHNHQTDTVNLRLLIGTICHVVVVMTILVVPWRLPRRERSLGLWLVVAAYALFALLMLQRILMFVTAGPMHSAFDLPALQSMSYLSAMLLPLISGVGFVQLFSQAAHDAVRRAAFVDAQTGCLNRHGFEEQLREHIGRVRRRGHTPAVIVLDIDMLKRINTTSGRAAGDDALRTLAAVLQTMCGKNGLVARTGDDEFAVLLESAGLSEAQAFGVRLRARLAELPPIGRGRFTVSLGLAAYVRGRDDFASLLQRAATAMQAQKQSD